MKKMAIIGAGSHTRSSINLIQSHFMSNPKAIYDDSFCTTKDEYICGIKVEGRIEDITDDMSVFLSVGNNNKRTELFSKFKFQIISDNVVHKTATIENNVKIGKSNQIYANSYINSYTKIGDNNIINTGAILEHDVVIGNNNHISVGAKLCGKAKIGNNCMIGSGAILIDKVILGNDIIIGAGTVVINNIEELGTYVGNPARKIK